jgi:hypothetical protein
LGKLPSCFCIGGIAINCASQNAANMNISFHVPSAFDLAAIKQGTHNHPRNLIARYNCAEPPNHV